jgi:hypothetical protein
MPRSGSQQQERRTNDGALQRIQTEPDQNHASSTARRPTCQQATPSKLRAAPGIRMPRSETCPDAKTHWRSGAAQPDAGFRASPAVRPPLRTDPEQRDRVPASRTPCPGSKFHPFKNTARHNGVCFTRGPIRLAGTNHVATTSASRIIEAKPRLALSTDPAENKAAGCKQSSEVPGTVHASRGHLQ